MAGRNHIRKKSTPKQFIHKRREVGAELARCETVSQRDTGLPRPDYLFRRFRCSLCRTQFALGRHQLRVSSRAGPHLIRTVHVQLGRLAVILRALVKLALRT